MPGPNTYSHCLPDVKGGVGLLAMNLSGNDLTLDDAGNGIAYVLQSAELDDRVVTANGERPVMMDDGSLGGLDGMASAGELSVPSLAIRFARFELADNPACSL